MRCKNCTFELTEIQVKSTKKLHYILLLSSCIRIKKCIVENGDLRYNLRFEDLQFAEQISEAIRESGQLHSSHFSSLCIMSFYVEYCTTPRYVTM